MPPVSLTTPATAPPASPIVPETSPVPRAQPAPARPEPPAPEAAKGLTSAELQLFERHRDALAGEVLELLPSGGPLTGELIRRAREYKGVGTSAALMAFCRHFHGAGRFVCSDPWELAELPEGHFTAVVTAGGAIDLLDEAGRCATLAAVRRVLRPGGVLIFASHNLAFSPAQALAEAERARAGKSLAGRLSRFSRRHQEPAGESDFAILSVLGLDAGQTRFHITRDGQERQLADHGFCLLECRDGEDRVAAAGELAEGSEQLHYVARPV